MASLPLVVTSALTTASPEIDTSAPSADAATAVAPEGVGGIVVLAGACVGSNEMSPCETRCTTPPFCPWPAAESAVPP